MPTFPIGYFLATFSNDLLKKKKPSIITYHKIQLLLSVIIRKWTRKLPAYRQFHMNHLIISGMQANSNKSLFLALISLLSIPLNSSTLTSKHFSPKQLSSSILLEDVSPFHMQNLQVIRNSFVFFFIPLDQKFSLPLPYICPFIFPVSYLPEVPRPSSPYKSCSGGFP